VRRVVGDRNEAPASEHHKGTTNDKGRAGRGRARGANRGSSRDILVWTKEPLHFRNELVLADAAVARVAELDEVKRLRQAPVVVEIAVDGASVSVAVHAEDRESALGPFVNR
jgi:anti-sigma-K factor RskA